MQAFNVSTDYEEIGTEKRSSNTWKHTALAVTILALVVVAVVAVGSQDQAGKTARQQMISLSGDNFESHCKKICDKIGARFGLQREEKPCEDDCPKDKPNDCPHVCGITCNKQAPKGQRADCPQFCDLECGKKMVFEPAADVTATEFHRRCHERCNAEGGDMDSEEKKKCRARCDQLLVPPNKKDCEARCPQRCAAGAHPSQLAECPRFCKDMCRGLPPLKMQGMPPVKMMQDNAVSAKCKSICKSIGQANSIPPSDIAECEKDCPNHRLPSGECRPQCMSMCEKRAKPSERGGCGLLCNAECVPGF